MIIHCVNTCPNIRVMLKKYKIEIIAATNNKIYTLAYLLFSKLLRNARAITQRSVFIEN